MPLETNISCHFSAAIFSLTNLLGRRSRRKSLARFDTVPFSPESQTGGSRGQYGSDALMFILTIWFGLKVGGYPQMETRRNQSPTSRVRPQWVNHPPCRSQSPSATPLGARGDFPASCLVGHQSDMVSLGLVLGLFRVGFRVGLRFLQGFLMVCFRVYFGLT